MEADTMYSMIERKLKNVKINVPADYTNVCREARKTPAKCNVEYLEHTYFKNFQNYLCFNSIRPGRGIGDPRVTDIRALQYLPDGTINFKLHFSDQWQPLPQRKNQKVERMALENFPHLYDKRLAIKRRKFDDLQELKSILEKDYHNFYNIPFK
ncbi:unnamed protein product [Psylliodes chrysocephalus]|uniref:Uncharacterized protein n=1 Tax=Psylliodes chrysocephalus TaxID=3402493 RepID=A0A9P0D3H9_9CUCU|nr:unnamed protein product [Psylliodes chrysocephala]